jgi:thiol-disulfide isomerase/thioredoxin
MAKGGFKKLKGGCMDSTLTNVLLVVVIALLLVLVYSYFGKSNGNSTQPTQKAMEQFEDFAPADLTPREGEVIVALYSANWCPHCKDYKPIWKNLKSQQNKINLHDNKKIRFVDVDCSKDAHPSSKQYKVEGYPTVVAISTKTHKHITQRNTVEDIVEEVSNM